MNKEQIDELFEMIVSRDFEEIASYFGIDKDASEEEITEVLKKTMSDIELGDFEYFKSFLKLEEYKEAALELYTFSSETEEVKEMIKNNNKHKIESYAITNAIIYINEQAFTKECIEEWKKVGLRANQLNDLIISIDEPEYVRKCIERRIELELVDIENYDFFISSLIEKVNDPQYIEECIEKRDEYGLNKYNIISLISALKDSSYTVKCIEKRDEYGLENYDIMTLIRTSIDDPAYMIKCIEKRDEYGLSKSDIIRTIIEKKDKVNIVKECIKKREEIKLDDSDIINITVESGCSIEILEDYENLNMDLTLIKEICDALKPEFFLENLLHISEQFKDEEFYEEFVKQYLGEVEFDKDKNPLIPEELKEIVFNVEDKEKAKKIKENLPQIIAKWDQIKEQIQYKKANSIKNDGLEIRFGIDEILSALPVLNKRNPQTVSEVEFENTPGSDRVGVDTQYTARPEVAVERAYELSRKMDEVKAEKKFPDFSVENEEMSLKVLHPQDKSAILLGFDTGCCFRPNGNADNDAENEYSLLQYATTTPYGGVIRVDSKENNDVYMGTPILRSGNCLMFHSYESTCSDTKKAEQVNELLDQAAIKAIEESKGKIKAVFMTSLHTGREKLEIKNRLTIGSLFNFYSEEEYKNYICMYNNLGIQNVVLAIDVDGEILTGEQIKEWYEKECSGEVGTFKGKTEIFKEKLGLELGKVEDTYEYPRRNVFHEIAIDNKPIVDKFSDRYKGLKKERNLIALFNKKKQLESKKELSKEDEESLRIIEEELEQYKKSAAYIEYSELSIKDIKKKLEANKEETLKVFSGEDIYIIAEVLGITREEIEQVIEDRVRAQQPKEDLEGKESSKAKKLKSMLISQIKESNNPELLKLISKVAKEEITEEEIRILQELGIETEEYEKACIRKEIIVDEEQRQADIVRVQKERLLKDKSVVEAIVADKIFGDVTQEEIDAQISEDLIKTVRTYIYDYYVSQDADGIITEAEKTIINNKIQELDIDNMISQCIDNNFESTEWIEKLNREFGLDVKSEYNKISSNPAKLKSKVQKSKLAKLKSDVSIGIRKKERIEKLQETIGYSEEQGEKKDFERMVFGNNWFIGFEFGKPIIHINPDISELDKEDLKVALRKEIDKAKEGKKTISMVEMRKVVSEVSLDDKKIGIKIMEDMLKEIENGERE